MKRFFSLLSVCLCAFLLSLALPVYAADLPHLTLNPQTGTIHDSNNREINLFGVNYYGGMYQYINTYHYDPPLQPRPLFNDLGFTNAATRRADVKTKVIDRDLDDLKRMGVEMIRIHVMMGDIANSDGSLRTGSDELDWFDYLMAGAISRGMYVYLTPVVAWDWYITLPGRISEANWRNTDYTSNITAINRMKTYIYNLMMHPNPYLSGRRYAAEPGIGLIEIMNEPWYLYDSSGNWNTGSYTYNFIKNTLINDSIQKVRDAEAAAGSGFQHLVGWSLYGQNTTYIPNPGAPSDPCAFTSPQAANPNVATAIRDSNAQFFAVSGYTSVWWKCYPYYGGPNGGPANEAFVNADNLAGYPGGFDLPTLKRGRTVYEWDAPSAQKFYILPNIAANMRKNGNQIVNWFQYDMLVDGHDNTTWPNHYVNYMYTPERSVSFMIARETFKDTRTWGSYADNSGGSNTISGYTTTSFPNNISLYFNGRKLMHTATIPSSMTPTVTAALEEIVGVGNSPVVTYNGTGLYRLTRVLSPGKNYLQLEINPDVTVNNRSYTVNGSSYTSTIYFDPVKYIMGNPALNDARTLSQTTRTMRVNFPGITDFALWRVNANGSETFISNYSNSASFSVQTGTVNNSLPRSANSVYYKLYPITTTTPNANYITNGSFDNCSLNHWSILWWGTSYSNAYSQSQTGQGCYIVHWATVPHSNYTYQIVDNIPNGTYTLSAKIIASSGYNSIWFGAQNFNASNGGDQSIALPTTGIGAWTTYTVSNITVQNHQVEVKLYLDAPNGEHWLSMDDVTLTRVQGGAGAMQQTDMMLEDPVENAVMEMPIEALPDSTATPLLPTPSATPLVVLTDAPVTLTEGSYEDNDPLLRYAGFWSPYGEGELSYTRSTTPHDRMAFTFKGTELVVYRAIGPNFGSMEVCINLVCQTVSNENAELVAEAGAVFTMPDEVHQAEVRVGESGDLRVNRVEVRLPAASTPVPVTPEITPDVALPTEETAAPAETTAPVEIVGTVVTETPVEAALTPDSPTMAATVEPSLP